MATGYYIAVSVHVLAALLWLGGMLFFGLVGAPVLRNIEPAQLRQQLFHTLGTRFRTAGWMAITVLVLSGLTMLHLRGLLSGTVLGNSDFWRSPFGHTLAMKIALVVAMLVLSAIHDFRLGPAAGRLDPLSNEAVAMRRRAAMLARVNGVLGLLLVLVAVRLARGG